MSNTYVSSQIVPQWDYSYGGSRWEELNSAEETLDGGYILAGFSSSLANDGNVTQPNQGVGDFWVVKTDEVGTVEWDARFGGDQLDRCNTVIQTLDGNYILGGTSASSVSGNKNSVNKGGEDFWLIKIDELGQLIWERSYGGTGNDQLTTVVETADGGLLIGGMSDSDANGDKSEPNRGAFDYWILKLTASGDIEWEKTLGGDLEERLNAIQIAPDGNFLIGGSTQSDAGFDISLPSIGIKDFWFIKVLSSNGNIIWERRLGGLQVEELSAFEQTADGGFFLAGGSNSNANQWKGEDSRGGLDIWGIKIDANGNKVWDITLGGSNLDNAYTIKQNSAGNFIIGGFTNSPVGGDRTETLQGGYDYWVIYLDANGNKIWDKLIGGTGNDVLFDVFQNSDGGYILAGASDSPISGDKSDDTNGLNDFWLMKTDCDINLSVPNLTICEGDTIDVDLDSLDNCSACTYLWNDIGLIDEPVRSLSPTTNTSYRVTITDLTGCEKSDDFQIVVTETPSSNLPNTLSFCADQAIPLDASSTAANSYEWSTSEVSPIITPLNSGMYYVTLTGDNDCFTIDSTRVQIHELPDIDLGNDTIICQNATLVLDAGNEGATYEWFPSGDNRIESFNLSSPTTISVNVSSPEGCVANDEISVLGFYQNPSIELLSISCDENNSSYSLNLAITGGVENTYELLSTHPYTQVGSEYWIESIEASEDFELAVYDENNCDTVIFNVQSPCICNSQAGTPLETSIEVCGLDTLVVEYVNQVLDTNDVVEYILHDGSANNIGNVRWRSTMPMIWYDEVLEYNTTYFLNARVGNASSDNRPSEDDACLNQSVGIPVTFYQAPNAIANTLGATSISCNQSTIVLSGDSSFPSTNLSYQWTTSEGNILTPSDQSEIEVNREGNYQLLVYNGVQTCSDSTNLIIETDEDYPTAIINISGQLSCDNSTISLDASASSNGFPFEAIWYGTGIEGETKLIQEVSQAGVYILEITNSENGCVSSDTVTITDNNLGAPIINISAPNEIECGENSVDINVELENLDIENASIIWSSNNGELIDVSTPTSVSVGSEGVYQVTITNLENNCTTTDSVLIYPSPNAITNAFITEVEPQCYGENTGLISIDSIVGGTSPYLYSFNNQAFSTVSFNENLPAGENIIKVQDAMGCEWKTIIELNSPVELTLEMESDETTIQLGDSTQIFTTFNKPVASFIWSDSTSQSCYTCPHPFVQPLISTVYSLTIIDQYGCRISDSLKITVNPSRNVFIPNAFSPNDDGNNDFFTIYTGKDVREISYLRIFNRWGAVLFEKKNFQSGTTESSWDGKFKGNSSPMGVYIYDVQLLYLDGHTEQISGDFTLFR